MRRRYQRRISILLIIALIAMNLIGVRLPISISAKETGMTLLTDEDVLALTKADNKNRTSVHDPSIVTNTDGTYYIFGSHMGVSKTNDLMNWETVTNESLNSNLFGNSDGEIVTYENAFITNAYTGTVNVVSGSSMNTSVVSGSSIITEKVFGTYNAAAWIDNNTIAGNMWAPDVIYNKTMNKWCMYLSLNGADWNSTIVLLTSESIEGPYVYEGPVVFSGFGKINSTKSYKDTDLELITGEMNELPEKYNHIADRTWGSFLPHAIDPCVFYDEYDNLWMTYGSWSGGIYLLELNEENGLRDYTIEYEDTSILGKNITSDPYFGVKIAGGHYVSGEGPYIEKIGDYYFLFMSYGFFSPEGGYNMRIFRSDTPEGPYLDEKGNNAIFDSYIMNYSPTNTSKNRGLKIMGNYKWNTMDVAEVAQGHNSAFVDSNGKAYVAYHTKFADGTASHEVRVHQMFLNEDGWLVAAPYEYTGETLKQEEVQLSEIIGDYDVIVHDFQIDYGNLAYKEPVTLSLLEDGSVSGVYTGTWNVDAGTSYVTLCLNGTEYKGVLIEQIIDGSNAKTMCFTVASKDGLSIWGSAKVSDAYAVAQTVKNKEVILPQIALKDLNLPAEGINGATISWKSSDENVLSSSGIITRPIEDTKVTLTKTVTKGAYYYQKDYTVLVKASGQNATESMLVASYFVGEQVDLSDKIDGSLFVANPYSNKVTEGLNLSGGITISFDIKSTGTVNALGTIFGFTGGGKLYLTPGSYLGYNGIGGYFDANIKDFKLVQDYIGDEANVSVQISKSGFSLSVNDKVVYTEAILNTENGFSTLSNFNDCLKWLNGTANRLYFGYGSWWNAPGFDNANCTISNVYCYVGPIDETISIKDEVTYTKDKVILATNTDITYEENPFYQKDIDNFSIEYKINLAENAAKNGWDGIFSFYNSKTGGRVSIQSAPYVCYNDGAGNWMDINQPGAGGNDAIVSCNPLEDVKFRITITKDGAVMTMNDEVIQIAINSSGVSYESLLSFITQCDQLSFGVGKAVTSYWWTEMCTLTDITIWSGERQKPVEPTTTPTPTITPEPTKPPEPILTPTPTVTPEPTKAPEPILTPTPTVTPEPTRAPEPTLTPTPTITPEPTDSREPTVTPTISPEKVEILSMKDHKELQKILDKDKNNSTAIIVEVTGGMEGNITVSVDISSNKELKSDMRVYVFRIDEKTQKFISIPGGYGYKVNGDNTIDLTLAEEGKYVILENPPTHDLLLSLPAQIWSTIDYDVLYFGGEIGATRKLSVHLPNTLKKVESFHEPTESKTIGEVLITFSSSDSSVATVSKDGIITAHGTGEAIITTKVVFATGKVKTMERTIVVKEPSIRIRLSKEKLSMNDTVTVIQKGLGYPTEDVIITIEDNGILEPLEATKFKAVRTGKVVISAKYKDKVVHKTIIIE